jgi:hypothetical protein
MPLNSSNARMIDGGYIRGSSSARAAPSPCSPDERPAVRDGEVRRVFQERPEVRDPGPRRQVEVDPHVQAAVAEVPVVDAAAAVPGQHACRTPAGRRPNRSGGTAASSQPGQASPPSGERVRIPAPSSRIRHSAFIRAGSLTTSDESAYGFIAGRDGLRGGVRLGPGRARRSRRRASRRPRAAAADAVSTGFDARSAAISPASIPSIVSGFSARTTITWSAAV